MELFECKCNINYESSYKEPPQQTQIVIIKVKPVYYYPNICLNIQNTQDLWFLNNGKKPYVTIYIGIIKFAYIKMSTLLI